MPSFRSLGWRDRSGLAPVFAAPVALWIWAEIAVLHGRGPAVRDLFD
ncbi:hypothetical protein [Nocardia sp. NPDC050793]